VSDSSVERDAFESRVLCYSMLIAVLFAGYILYLRALYGVFLDPAFEIAICYLPAVLLVAMYAWSRFKTRD